MYFHFFSLFVDSPCVMSREVVILIDGDIFREDEKREERIDALKRCSLLLDFFFFVCRFFVCNVTRDCDSY